MFKLVECGLDFLDSAPHCIQNSIIVQAKPEDLFDLVSFSTQVKWFPLFRDITWLTTGEPTVGSIRLFRTYYLSLKEYFLIWERGRRIVFRGMEISLPLVSTFIEDYQLSVVDDVSTQFTWRVCYELNPWVKPFGPLLKWYFSREFKKACLNIVKLFNP